MSTMEIRALYASPMAVGESPLWHPEESALYWIDIPARMVHRHIPGSGLHTAWNLPSEPGCIARCLSGGLVVAMRSGISLLDTVSGALTQVVGATYDTTYIRFNDGRCDGAGRLWIGTMYEPRDRPGGSLYSLDRGRLHDKGMPVTVSNGLAFDAARQSLYHADTTAHVVRRYDFDMENGAVTNGRVFKQFSPDRKDGYGGRPDGAAVDREGAYWVAMFEGSRLLRIDPTGAILLEVPLPVKCPTMVAFGGADLKTLYVTTASQKRSAEELAALPLSGCVLALPVDVPGCVEPAYIP